MIDGTIYFEVLSAIVRVGRLYRVKKTKRGMRIGMVLLKQIKNTHLELIGEIHRTEEGVVYKTTRDNHLKQVYTHKKVFVSHDGKDTYRGENCIGIDLDICKTLLVNNVDVIRFTILNFPKVGVHKFGKIPLVDFLSKSITIQERGQDKQRIIAMGELK